MTCYDETRDADDLPTVRSGPTVVRDCNNVREIADDPAAFALHVRPRHKGGRNDSWRPDEH